MLFLTYVCFAIKEQIMSLSKILGGILILLSVFFLGLQSQMLEVEASGIRALAMLLLLTLYIFKVDFCRIYFDWVQWFQ